LLSFKYQTHGTEKYVQENKLKTKQFVLSASSMTKKKIVESVTFATYLLNRETRWKRRQTFVYTFPLYKK
jgi:hypothetical protein